MYRFSIENIGKIIWRVPTSLKCFIQTESLPKSVFKPHLLNSWKFSIDSDFLLHFVPKQNIREENSATPQSSAIRANPSSHFAKNDQNIHLVYTCSFLQWNFRFRTANCIAEMVRIGLDKSIVDLGKWLCRHRFSTRKGGGSSLAAGRELTKRRTADSAWRPTGGWTIVRTPSLVAAFRESNINPASTFCPINEYYYSLK